MNKYRQDFPLLKRQYQGQSLVYFDNAATAPKLNCVIDAVTDYYKNYTANVHRGQNWLAEEATMQFEQARQRVARLMRAEMEEIIFTSGTTASINMVAKSWGEANLQEGDVIAVSKAEHHANLVPWQQLKQKIGIEIVFIDLDEASQLSETSWRKCLANPRLKLIAVTGCSNVLGVYQNLSELLREARKLGVVTLVDVAQSIVHRQVDVRELDCDFCVWSGHKLFGPSGVGVLYAHKKIQDSLPNFLGGGGMICRVTEDAFWPAEAPYCYEAGTPNIEGVIGLGEACYYIMEQGYENLVREDGVLTEYFLKKIEERHSVKLLGSTKNRLPLFAMTVEGVHAHDLADMLGEKGIITRAGRHCAHPLHDSLDVVSSLRASLAFYNTTEEIDYFWSELDAITSRFQTK